MPDAARIGRYIFATALVGFGVQYLVSASPINGPAVGPPWPAAVHITAALLGLLLVILGAGIVANKTGRSAALLVALAQFLFVAFFYIPKIIANVHDPASWTSSSEILALCGAALFLAGSMSIQGANEPERSRRMQLANRIAPLVFALGLIVFGVQHFIYGAYVATLIPAWIPARLFWAYFVGAAFFAAALAISTGIQARLAAILLGAMFFLWVLILHLPRVVATPSKGSEWTSALIALAMAGGSCVFTSTVTDRKLFQVHGS